jgi:homocysteine S-methyltransferase
MATGIAYARKMLAVARERFAGVCIMPPFDRYDILADILA